MSAAKTINWGIAGTGKICADFYAALQAVEGAKVTGVASRTVEKAKQFAEPRNVPNAFGSHAELAKSGVVDIVYIGVIHTYHAQLALEYLNNGVAVLCEKPMTMNGKQGEDVMNAAKKANLFLMEGVWTRFFPGIKKVQELISEGKIGEVKTVSVNFGFDATTSDNPRLNKLEYGAGALLDIGIYTISFASMIFGPEMPTTINASGVLSPEGFDEQNAIFLGYKGGRTAVLSSSFVSPQNNAASIWGTKGRIIVPQPFWCPPKIQLFVGDAEKPEVFDFPMPPNSMEKIKPELAKLNFVNGTGMMYEAEHVTRCMQEGKTESPLMPLDESMVFCKIIDEVKKQIGLVYPQDKKN